METLLIVLVTLKILGAVLLAALATALHFGKVFSPWFRLYLWVQAVTVLSYSQGSESVMATRMEHPVGFALGSLPFLFLIPPLFLAARSTLERPLRIRNSRILIAGVAVYLGFVVAIALYNPLLTLLPGPGSPVIVSAVWNLWHLSWSVAAIVILRPSEAKRAPILEVRILRWLSAFALILIISSAILERISFRLDFLVTPILMITAVYAAVGLLVAASPKLIRLSRERYADSDLDRGAAESLAGKARHIVEEAALWRNGELSLSDVAGRCAASPRDLSQAINQVMGRGFPAWIREYRLEEACRLLGASEGKIADIAFESGFNSLSSFNTAFREQFGQTPGEWRRQNRLSNS